MSLVSYFITRIFSILVIILWVLCLSCGGYSFVMVSCFEYSLIRKRGRKICKGKKIKKEKDKGMEKRQAKGGERGREGRERRREGGNRKRGKLAERRDKRKEGSKEEGKEIKGGKGKGRHEEKE